MRRFDEPVVPKPGLPSATYVCEAVPRPATAPRVDLAAPPAAAVPPVVLGPRHGERVKAEATAPGLLAHSGLRRMLRIGSRYAHVRPIRKVSPAGLVIISPKGRLVVPEELRMPASHLGNACLNHVEPGASGRTT